VLEPDSDQTKALRALTRARQDLVHTKVAVANQLRAELERFWPGPIGLFSDLDSQISLAFLERYPSPADARTLGEQRLQAFLNRQHYSGPQKPIKLLAKLKRAPEGRIGETELKVRRQLVLALVATLKTLTAQIRTLEREIATAVREHPDGQIFLSLFKDPNSFICAAELLAEIGDCRARYPTRDSLAADAGQAAVAIESGKRKTACFRRGCNKRLRTSFSTLADSTRKWHPSPPTTTPTPEPAATTTHARSAPSDAPGAVSCGAAGKTAPRMTPPATALSKRTARSPSPTRRGPAPTSLPHSGCSAPTSPNRRPAGPSAKRSTTSRNPLPHTEVDTGRPLSCCGDHEQQSRRRCRRPAEAIADSCEQKRMICSRSGAARGQTRACRQRRDTAAPSKVSKPLRSLLDAEGVRNLGKPQRPWTAGRVANDMLYMMNRAIPTSQVAKVVPPSVSDAEAAPFR
jgi:transposase